MILLEAGLILLAGWFVYAPALNGAWVWDDTFEVGKNPVLAEPGGFWKAWSAPAGTDYLPVKSDVQWIEWHLWRDNVLGWHLTNLGLHLLAAFLLWRLLSKLGVRLAWIGGLLFAVHPLAVESVAWISELKNTLSLPLLLLSALAYMRFDDMQGDRGRRCHWRARLRPRRGGHGLSDEASAKSEGPPSMGAATSVALQSPIADTQGSRARWCHLASLLLFAAAMLSKASVVMFPFVILLHAWWRRGRISRRDVLASAPFFAVSLALGLVAVWFQDHRAIEDLVVSQGGALSRVAVAGMAVAFYLSKSVVPVNLLPAYPRWDADPPSLLQLVPAVVLAGVLLWLWAKRWTYGRHVLFGLGFFLLNLAPVLGFVPMSYMRFSWVADHFAYLPLVGLVGLAAAGLSGLSFRRLPGAAILTPALALAVIAFAAGARLHAAIFRSDAALWSYTLRQDPDSWLAHNNLGDVLSKAGRNAEAMAQFEDAVRLNPDYPEAQDNLGVVQVAAGRLDEGIARYERALALKPDFPAAEFNLGIALFQARRLDAAIAHFEKAVALKPSYAEARNGLGVALAQAGRTSDAAAEFEEALRINPGLGEARSNLEIVRKIRR
jgi:Flp pilus assembly protein TadD